MLNHDVFKYVRYFLTCYSKGMLQFLIEINDFGKYFVRK